MTSSNDIRAKFLDYFRALDHEIVSSSPLVPRNDPSLMFTNAGMVQFKNLFTGAETRDYTRAASSQKCVRAGGKHNDLDNVGHTARHHTFFEMLGNFSFGDYFKDVAIEMSWNLLTREFGLDADRLLITVFAEDDEAFDLWRKISGLGNDKILRIATSENFWTMGETGPCGPCSEIFYDHGEHIAGGPPGSPNQDGDRFVEIWNLVFMQFEQIAKDKRIDLPRRSIDTGMGLERIAAILQGSHDNYDIDMLRTLIDAVTEYTGVAPEGNAGISHRVIADHLRSSSFLIADGVLPSNEGRGYVLRRIMRRAMRHAHMLGGDGLLMWRLVASLVNEMGQAFPELVRAQSLIEETQKLEEQRFRTTLERGLKILDEELAGLGGGQALPGEVAFKLYDTYGFPLDLTQDALRPQGIDVDVEGFNAAMEKQRARARASWVGSGEVAVEKIWLDLMAAHGPSEFLGYGMVKAEGQIVALAANGKAVKKLKKGDTAAVILNRTPFYGEAGGQVGDRGLLRTAGGAVFEVSDTQKQGGELFVHYGRVMEGIFCTGDMVQAEINDDWRRAIRGNHSGTHILHEALRRVLGDHVVQKGSLVDADKLRFDFSHQKAMTRDEIAAVEDLANRVVLRNSPVRTRVMAVDEAMEAGALALFGEKYGEEVRVVAMGEDDAEDADRSYSVELCGGTHVKRTGDIGLIKITSESAVGAGVRRIEAVTGSAARAYLTQREQMVRDMARRLKTTVEDLPDRVAVLVEERTKLDRELAAAKKQLALTSAAASDQGDDMIQEISGVKVLARVLDGVHPKDLRGLADDGKKRLGSGIVVIVGVNDDKAGIVVGISDDLTDAHNAVDLVKLGAEALGGKGGGGRPDMAQAGGPNGARAQQAVAAVLGAL